MTFAAGIVTCNADIARLELNIKAIKPQVEFVVISDNGTEDIEGLRNLCQKYGVYLIENGENKGIAYALNRCMEYGKKHGADFVVTLDHDSICPDNLIEEVKECDAKEVAMFVPLLLESASGELCLLGAKVNGIYQEVEKCITSASVTNVSVWEKIGGFDEKLFIDYVDYDYAMRCRLAGYKIIRMNNATLDHQIGASEYRHILWKKIRVANHSAFRKYYIGRNIIIFIRRYKRYISITAEMLRLFKMIGLTILFEENKGEKLKATFKGIRDGIKMNIRVEKLKEK